MRPVSLCIRRTFVGRKKNVNCKRPAGSVQNSPQHTWLRWMVPRWRKHLSYRPEVTRSVQKGVHYEKKKNPRNPKALFAETEGSNAGVIAALASASKNVVGSAASASFSWHWQWYRPRRGYFKPYNTSPHLAVALLRATDDVWSDSLRRCT